VKEHPCILTYKFITTQHIVYPYILMNQCNHNTIAPKGVDCSGIKSQISLNNESRKVRCPPEHRVQGSTVLQSTQGSRVGKQ